MAAAVLDDIAARIRQLEADARIHADFEPELSQRWADCIARGEVLFYGKQVVPVGLTDIDWSGPHVNHQEWPAQLNRFFWLRPMALMYQAQPDPELAHHARRTIEDWINQHDYHADAPPAPRDNTLNISIRLGQLGQGAAVGWWGSAARFAGSDAYDDAFVQRMIASTQGQAACLQAHLGPKGNWRISHLDCLLYVGLVVPGCEAFVDFAVPRLTEAFYRQIGRDGSHEEHNPSYHGWMCRAFTRLWTLSQARPEIDLRLDSHRVARMWDYLLASTPPDGSSPGLHDGPPSRPRPGKDLASLRQERDAVHRDAGLDPSQGPLDQWFADAGQLFVRNDWSPHAAWWHFDATRWGGGHCHLSRLAVSLWAHDRMLLNDPGTFTYEMTDPFATYGKATPAHNTIHIDGLSQCEAEADVRVLRQFDRFTVVAARYAGGYWPGTYKWGWNQGKGAGAWAQHDRVWVRLGDRAAVVFDVIRTDGEPRRVAAHWHLPPGPAQLDAPQRQARTIDPDAQGQVLVRLLAATRDVDLELVEGQSEPLLGWTPRSPGDYQPAPTLTMTMRTQGETNEMVSLLMPYAGADQPAFEVDIAPRQLGQPHDLTFRWADGVTHRLIASPALASCIDRIGEVESDSPLAVLETTADGQTHAALLEGMRLTIAGQTWFNEPHWGAHETSQPGE